MKTMKIMRNIVSKIAVLVIVIGASLTSYASADSASLASFCKIMPIEDENRFKLIYQSPVTETVEIKLVDKNDRIVYSETVDKTNGFIKNFDVSNLPDGAYVLNVSSDDYKYSEYINVASWDAGKLHLVVTESNRKYALVGTNDSKEAVTLYILDQTGATLYKEVIPAGEQVKKMYDLKKVYGQRASFVIYGKDGIAKEKMVKL